MAKIMAAQPVAVRKVDVNEMIAKNAPAFKSGLVVLKWVDLQVMHVFNHAYYRILID